MKYNYIQLPYMYKLDLQLLSHQKYLTPLSK